MFHTHTWEEVGRVFTPRFAGVEATGLSSEMFSDLAFGFTTIELRCHECGDIKFVKTLGDSTKKEAVSK